MLEDGTTEAVGYLQNHLHLLMANAVRQLSTHLLALSTYFVDLLRSELKKYPPSLLSLPDHLAPAISDQVREPTPRQPRFASTWEIDPRDEQSRRNNASSVPPGASRNKNAPSSLRPPPPTPIIPILTPEARSLSSFLRSYAASPAPVPSAVISDSPPPSPSLAHSTSTPSSPTLGVVLHTKPINPPTVPKGTSRVRICLQASHTREDVGLLAQGIVAWAEKRMAEEHRGKKRWQALARDVGVGVWMEAKL